VALGDVAPVGGREVLHRPCVQQVLPPAPARPRCSPSSACSTRPPAASTCWTASPVQDLSPSDRAHVRNRHIGFIFQSFNLIGDLTVFENVELPLTYRGMPAAERKKRVEDALNRVGMSHRARHMPGAALRRPAAARGGVAGGGRDPLILLADEPTGNLDSKNGQAVMKLLSELHQGGSTLIMVTHDPHAWAQSLRDGTYESVEMLAEASRLHPKVIRQALRLAFLSPNVTSAILAGSQPAALSLAQNPKAPSVAWTEHRRLLADVRGSAVMNIQLISFGAISSSIDSGPSARYFLIYLPEA